MRRPFHDREKYARSARRRAFQIVEQIGTEHMLSIGDDRMRADNTRFLDLVEREALSLFDKALQLGNLPAQHNVVRLTLRQTR